MFFLQVGPWYPYVTGTSISGIKYKDGILMAADMGACMTICGMMGTHLDLKRCTTIYICVHVSMIGLHYEDVHIATGFGNHLARPILREELREDLSFEEGVKLLEKCMRNLLYRDRSAVNKLQIAKITEEGLTVSPPYSLKTFWNSAAFQNPTVGTVGSW
ncbi:putative proteasome endopeptidase complex [Helianthus annuus]|nr:putative proteasome endopeptidase complex [Helianthus annuus]KAJ0541211.1 putative proteasome endopeptidase complex [Helianthus annuus]KAJ0706293.1 putative proteasome endopeptidase complex [Helianthus annuus]KAJ0886785.1 putative proteasome endopeptidase complex [Helianthus annuus]